MGSAARRVVDRRGPSGPARDRGVAVGRDAHLRGSSRAGAPARPRAAQPRVRTRRRSSPTPCPTTSTSCGGSWPRRRPGFTPIALNPALSATEIGSHPRALGRDRPRVGISTPAMSPAAARARCPAVAWSRSTAPSTASSGTKTSSPGRPDRARRPAVRHADLLLVGHDGQAEGDHPHVAWPVDPSVIADSMKLFGHAFRFHPLDGVHLVSAGMHHGGCQGFYHGALNVGQALVILGKFDAEADAAPDRASTG